MAPWLSVKVLINGGWNEHGWYLTIPTGLDISQELLVMAGSTDMSADDKYNRNRMIIMSSDCRSWTNSIIVMQKRIKQRMQASKTKVVTINEYKTTGQFYTVTHTSWQSGLTWLLEV